MNNGKLEHMNINVSLASAEDAKSIFDLQQKLLGKNRSETEKAAAGFVSVENTPEQLTEIIEQDGITVARDGMRVVGYIMPLTLEQARRIPLLDPFIERFGKLEFEGRPLNVYTYCIIGQIGVEDRYAGRGLPEKMYPEFAARMGERFQLGVTEVGANNPRSLHVHRDKIGMTVAEEYSADGRDWYIFIMDFRKYKKDA